MLCDQEPVRWSSVLRHGSATHRLSPAARPRVCSCRAPSSRRVGRAVTSVPRASAAGPVRTTSGSNVARAASRAQGCPAPRRHGRTACRRPVELDARQPFGPRRARASRCRVASPCGRRSTSTTAKRTSRNVAGVSSSSRPSHRTAARSKRGSPDSASRARISSASLSPTRGSSAAAASTASSRCVARASRNRVVAADDTNACSHARPRAARGVCRFVVRVRAPGRRACTGRRRRPAVDAEAARCRRPAPLAAVNTHPHDHDGEPGTVYVLHFDPPYRHAGHYIGWAQDADARIAQHIAGVGSPLVRAAVLAGSHVQLAAIFSGSRYLERRLKRWHNTTARVCPICRARRAGSAVAAPRGRRSVACRSDCPRSLVASSL